MTLGINEKNEEYTISILEMGEWKPQAREDDRLKAMMRAFELLEENDSVLIEKRHEPKR